jgi:hypothetical protein
MTVSRRTPRVGGIRPGAPSVRARAATTAGALALASLLGAPSCGTRGDRRGEGDACTRSRDCDDGLVCVGGECRVPADGAVPADAAAAADGPAPEDGWAPVEDGAQDAAREEDGG